MKLIYITNYIPFIWQVRILTLSVVFVLSSYQSNASHIYGMDFFYTHVSGNTYTVSLHVYGDCSGSSFSSLSTSAPEIAIYDGGLLKIYDTLIIQSPTSGVDVTPVCPAQGSNTTCKNGIIPGIKKFVYSKNITLPSTSANWRFRFLGTMGNNFLAGRSNSITNIIFPTGGSVTEMLATLDNTSGPNSSPTFTTIPTPFFCIGKAVSYNPGAVDANNDSLTYALVPGLPRVTYNTGYSGTAPLAVATGTFSSSATTGQVNFTPNLVQRSLVVQTVEEYKGGKLIGSAMREMTFIVLNNCNNNPPGGKITNNNTGIVSSDGTSITVCKSAGNLTFNIYPSDADNQTINVSYSGIPTGSSMTLTNNNTKSPSASFSWNLSGVAPGAYTFFFTYQDDGCPLVSKQTIAYTIHIPPPPTATITIKDALCNGTASGEVTLSGKGTVSPYTYAIGTGAYSSSPIFSSLAKGTYTFKIKDNAGCENDTTVSVNEPTPVKFGSIQTSDALCNGNATGKITVAGTGGTTPYTYAFATSGYGSNTTFTSLVKGIYALHVKDANGCIADSVAVVAEPAPIDFSNLKVTSPLCHNTSTGSIVASAVGGNGIYTYAIGTGTFTSSNTFNSLAAGQYIVKVKDTNSCQKDSTITITDATKIIPTALVTRSTCVPLNNGTVTLSATGGKPSYTYAVGTGSYSTKATFTFIASGTYTFHIKDKNNCVIDTNVTVNDSFKLSITSSVTDAACFDSSSGSAVFSTNGGELPYLYSFAGGAYGSASSFSNLKANTYSIRVKDNRGCSTATSITVKEPTQVYPVLELTQPACKGNSNGSIQVSATGGTPAYQQAFNNGTFSAIAPITGLIKGNYIISIKDSKGCRADTTVLLDEPGLLAFTLIPGNLLCKGDASGNVQVAGSGGTTLYMYTYDSKPFTSFSKLTGMSAGSHTITIRDKNNCLVDSTITLTEPDKLFIDSLDITNPTCEGFTDGSVQVTGSGGTPPYMYVANNGTLSAEDVLTGLGEGAHIVTIKDANNCIVDSTVTLIGYPHIIYDNIAIEGVKCFGGNDGKVFLNAFGGIRPFTFSFGNNPPTDNPSFQNLSAGKYTFTITDSGGCIKDSSATIEQPDKLVVEAIASPNDCEGYDTDGKLEANVTGGVAAYEYTWTSTQEHYGKVINGVANGTYKVMVEDANGCLDSAATTVVYDNCCKLFIPDAFTPNRDGLNDLIHVLVKGDFKLEIFAIYNRFGERVFYTNSMSDGWDGMYKANLQDLGTYNYFVKGICGNAGVKEVMYKGTITLIR